MSISLHIWLGIPTAIAFLLYGVSCLCTATMRREFERFGLPQFRILIGSTQLLGAFGLFLAMWFPWLGFLGAAGLAIQMLAGVGVRIQMKDTWMQTSQAVIFLVITIILAVGYARLL